MKTRTSTLAEKIIMIVGVIFCAILIPLLIINITIIVKGTLNPKTPPSIFGVTPLVVMSGSMDDGSKDCISTGDLIFSRNIDTDNLKIGDIISFMDGKSAVTHRIVRIESNEHGEPVFITKGDANNSEDQNTVTKDSIIGLYVFRIPAVGDFALFMQTGLGMMCFIGIPVIAFIVYDILRRLHYARKKDEATAKMQAEIDRLRKIAEENQTSENIDIDNQSSSEQKEEVQKI